MVNWLCLFLLPSNQFQNFRFIKRHPQTLVLSDSSTHFSGPPTSNTLYNDKSGLVIFYPIIKRLQGQRFQHFIAPAQYWVKKFFLKHYYRISCRNVSTFLLFNLLWRSKIMSIHILHDSWKQWNQPLAFSRAPLNFMRGHALTTIIYLVILFWT